MPVVRTYRPDQRPDIEVLVDGHWYEGELRQWSKDDEGQWSAQVNWRRAAGDTLIDTFSTAQVTGQNRSVRNMKDCSSAYVARHGSSRMGVVNRGTLVGFLGVDGRLAGVASLPRGGSPARHP